MITTHQFDLFFSENEKSFVITKAKVGSRFITEMYHPNTQVIPLDINLEFTHANVDKPSKDMFYRFNDKENNNKMIFLIYRNPLKRFISGTVEDLLVSIGTNNFNEKFFLKNYVTKHNIDPYKLYQDLDKNQENRNFLLEDYYVDFLTNLIEDWFYWQISTSPITSHHSSPYLAIYDTILKSPNINSNNIRLVNIDDKDISLQNVLTPYLESGFDIDKNDVVRLRQSNKNFYDFIKSMLNENKFFNDLSQNVCEIDNYFYNEFEKSNLNIKNEI